jgi:hypothetical protein
VNTEKKQSAVAFLPILQRCPFSHSCLAAFDFKCIYFFFRAAAITTKKPEPRDYKA